MPISVCPTPAAAEALGRLAVVRDRLQADRTLRLSNVIYSGYWSDVETVQEAQRQEAAVRRQQQSREFWSGTGVLYYGTTPPS